MASTEQQNEVIPTESLKDLAEQKEKEWRELQHLRFVRQCYVVQSCAISISNSVHSSGTLKV